VSVESTLKPLTRAEWEALLFEAPASIRRLVFKLAVFHGVVGAAPGERCPCCGRLPEEPARQLTLEEAEG